MLKQWSSNNESSNNSNNNGNTKSNHRHRTENANFVLNKDKNDIVFIAEAGDFALECEPQTINFIIDSGASEHMANNEL